MLLQHMKPLKSYAVSKLQAGCDWYYFAYLENWNHLQDSISIPELYVPVYLFQTVCLKNII